MVGRESEGVDALLEIEVADFESLPGLFEHAGARGPVVVGKEVRVVRMVNDDFQ